MVNLWPNTKETELHKHHSYRLFSSHRGMNLLQLCLLQAEHRLLSCFFTIRLNCMRIFLTGAISTETIWNSGAMLGSFWHEHHFSFEGSLRTKCKIPWGDWLQERSYFFFNMRDIPSFFSVLWGLIRADFLAVWSDKILNGPSYVKASCVSLSFACVCVKSVFVCLNPLPSPCLKLALSRSHPPLLFLTLWNFKD